MNPINLNDPRLTAYALHEMEPAEQARFEQELGNDPGAQQAVEEIRAAAAVFEQALENEPAEALPAAPGRKKPGKLLRFPRFYYVVSGLAAACFAVIFILQEQREVEKANKHLIEVPLAASATAAAKDKTVADAAEEKTAKAGGARVHLEMPSAMAVPAKPEPVPMMMDKFDAPLGRMAHGTGGVEADYSAALKKENSPDQGFATMRETEARRQKAPERAGQGFNTEAYAYRKDNDYLRVTDQPLSTLSVDVDTASYTNVRRFLTQGQRPPADAVRIEEMINYFPYNYAGPDSPQSRDEATGPVFATHLEVADAPWAPEHRLVRIGLKGRELSEAARPVANLVFLIDVSGSMDQPNKLPLVKQSLRLLVEKLRPDDRVAIAVYAGASGLALPSTSVAHKADILDAIDRLDAGGSTNGAAGIQLAYDIAKANFIPGGVNHVILATDGDFNVGVSSEGELMRLIGEKTKSGVFLSVLGFGMGNYKDATLEQLADKGNGNYAYIDSLAEAKKSLVEQAGGTLVTIAKDVKLQVEFNPALVQAYRLIGYEDRMLAKEDFNNDQVDAGEIGAGHTVTALYEIVPVGAETVATPGVDPLKYQKTGAGGQKPGNRDELLTVKIRYKEPSGEVSRKVEFPLRDAGARFENASPDFKFAAAVAAFGMVLRDSPYKGRATLPEVAAWGRAGLGSDPGGYRNEFIGLVGQAQKILQ